MYKFCTNRRNTMKTLHYIIAGLFLSLNSASFAQASVADRIEKISTEDELPSLGVRYYYYPNLDAYYDIRTNLYLFEQQGQWIKSKELTSGYRGYSLFNGVRVAINDYNGDTPYSQIKSHQEQFPKKYSSKRKPPKTTIEKEEMKVAYK